MRTNRTEIKLNDDEQALVDAASAISHPTAKGANVARMIRESAVSAARRTFMAESDRIGRLACRAPDLDELQEALQLHEELQESVKHIDGLAHDLMVNMGGWIADVPSWGDEPDDTEGLVSFDATRLLWMEDYSVSQRDVSLESLEDLQAAMKDEHPSILDGDDWSTDLPTFGGDEPDDTAGVWSWDAERLLVGTCADDLTIYTRDEWDDQ